MKREQGNRSGREILDAELDAALANFRSSVHAWGEAEFRRPRSLESLKAARVGMGWRMLASPVLSWGLAAGIAMAAVVTPVTIHRERQVALERQQHELQARQELEARAKAMDDEELLRHVDSDIAQAAPDAMEPLASLMSESAGQ